MEIYNKGIYNKEEASLVLKRPNFGKSQITDSMQLAIGESYIRHGAGVEGRKIKILEVPYLDGDNDLRVDVLTNNGITFLFLSDLGISPYSGYKDNKYRWHRHHWVEPLNKSGGD